MYRKTIVLLIIILKITFNQDVYAQSYSKLNIYKAPDDQSSTNIIVLSDKSIIVATRVRADGWGLLHIDEHNNIIKSKEFTNTRLLNKLILTKDGNLLLVGSVGLNTNTEIGVIKIDMNFNIIWSKKISGAAMCYAYSALECSNNDILITGYSSITGNSPGDWDSFVCRITENGVLLWKKIIVNSSSASDWLLESIEVSNGNFILSGATHIGGSVDFMLIKISANGTIIFNKHFGASQNEVVYNLTKSSFNGRYIISAGSWSYGLGEYDLLLAELDTNLNVMWSKVYGGSKFDFPIATLIDGNKIITAAYSKSYNSSNNFDVVAYEFNHATGALLNTMVLGKGGEELFGSLGNVLTKKSTNKYLMTGHTKSYSSESDVFISEFNFVPNSCCDFLNIGTTTIIDQPLSLTNFSTSTENTTLNNISNFNASVINFIIAPDSLCVNKSNINNSIITSNINLCVNVPLNFNTTFVDNTFNYNWNFGDPGSGSNNSAAGTNVSHQFSHAGTYLITCIISNACISDTDSVYINITIPTPFNNNIVLNNTTFCKSNEYVFDASYLSNQHFYEWDFGDPASGLNNYSNETTPSHTFSKSGTFLITCIVSDGCTSDTDTVSINVIEPIALNTQILNLNTSYCKKQQVDFVASSDDATANYFWNFGDPNSSDNNSSIQNPSHNFSSAGIYTVRLISTNICLSDTTTLELNIRENPIPDFDFSIDTCSSELTLTNTSIDIANNNYEWYVNNININQSVFNYAIENNTNYEIKLLANKNTECADSISTTINYIVDDSNQYLSIPDAFSPNGDNQNDVFVIRTSSKCLLEELKIYDRYGSIIYKQYDEDKFYWDGKINNTTQADGVYIVHLKYNGKQYIRTLSLIK